MFTMLTSRSSGLSSSIGRWIGHCVVFLGKSLHYHHASLLTPGLQMGIGEFNAGVNLALDQHLIQGGIEIFLVDA